MLYFVDRFLPVVARRIIHLHGQIDRLVPPVHASLNKPTPNQ
jgi:hypothetical protein